MKADDKHTYTFAVPNNMEQQKIKSNWNSLIYREDARPWDDFVTNADSSTTVDKDMK